SSKAVAVSFLRAHAGTGSAGCEVHHGGASGSETGAHDRASVGGATGPRLHIGAALHGPHTWPFARSWAGAARSWRPSRVDRGGSGYGHERSDVGAYPECRGFGRASRRFLGSTPTASRAGRRCHSLTRCICDGAGQGT